MSKYKFHAVAFMIFLFFVQGCGNKLPEPKPIPLAFSSEGSYAGYQTGEIRIKNHHGMEIFHVSNNMKRKIKGMNIKKGSYVHVDYYREVYKGNIKSGIKYVRHIELINEKRQPMDDMKG
ncbi:hypothetical protein DCCM_3215 [Desulfocucumis palustris]|uniref:Lipoprotein n=1 Tax=Desulfocucumis palustris TaxID=1898651 RepID=A0A2L2XEG9_9FIRM|nr:hypothetical protein [Desulfocucumis palustris]GBF34103.1 hypothetical protein DCCM_3215 [Desulfocucumis palustris]